MNNSTKMLGVTIQILKTYKARI